MCLLYSKWDAITQCFLPQCQISPLPEPPRPVQANDSRQTHWPPAHPVRNKWKSCYPADWWCVALTPPSLSADPADFGRMLLTGRGGRGGNLANRQRSNNRQTSKLPPTVENNWRWVHGCCPGCTVCLWMGHRCLSADLWLCLANSVWLDNN